MNSPINAGQPFGRFTESLENKPSGWRAQFACPTGKMGWVAGQLMAFKNANMNAFAVDALDVQPEDQILEIGFGHGRTIGLIAEQATKGHVAGVDLSEVMVRQAAKRNRSHILAGRVEVCQGTVANLPYEHGRFAKVLAVNNYQFWPSPEHNLVEVQRVLGKGGSLVLCLRMKQPDKLFQLAPGFTEREVEEVAGLVRWVGFKDVQRIRQINSREAICIVASR
jgi:ubiquinone/menaquinone biosynthesis C-methylase UbiE